jgi:hypothetical protein
LTHKGKTSKPWNLDQDQTDACDETAVQSNFRTHLGDPVTAICSVTGRNAQVTDFKATNAVPIGRLTPNLAIKVGNTLGGSRGGESILCGGAQSGFGCGEI